MDTSPWLTLGKTYHVLEVVFDPQTAWTLRLDQEAGAGLFPLKDFEITSSKIPRSWIARWNDKGLFELTPDAWSQPDFWERYFEHDPQAVKVFETEKDKIVGDDP